MNTDDGLCPLEPAAQRLSVSAQTLRRWGREKRLTLIRLPGGTLRVRVADINRLVNGDAGDE